MRGILFVILISFSANTEDLFLKSLQLTKGKNPNLADPIHVGCTSPRSTISTFVYGDGDEVIACFEKTSHTKEQLLLAAKQLLEILRAKGILLKPTDVPDESDYINPITKKARYLLSPQLSIYLQKNNGLWVFNKETIDQIDEIYAKSKKVNLGWFYSVVPAWATYDLFGISGLSTAQVALVLLLILLGLVVRLITASIVSRHVGKIFLRLGMHEFEGLTQKASFPIGNLAMAALLGMFIPSLDLNVHITHYFLVTIRLFAGVSAVLMAYRSVDVFAYYLLERALKTQSKLDDQLVPIFRKGLKITICIVGAIFVLQNLDIDVTSLLAGVTIGGLAFSFAARDTVANLFGSITIFADKPFLVGDWIKAAGVEGIVEAVGFRSTRIRTFYNSLVSVPNSKFTDSVVDNLGARQYRRTLAEIGVTYDTAPEQIEAFCNGIRAIILSHPLTRKDYYEIHFSAFGDFSLKIMLYFFVSVPTWTDELRSRHEVYLDILRLAKKMKIQFAFPTQTLHVDSLVTAQEKNPRITPTEDDLKKAAEYFSPTGEGVIPPGPRIGKSFFAGENK